MESDQVINNEWAIGWKRLAGRLAGLSTRMKIVIVLVVLLVLGRCAFRGQGERVTEMTEYLLLTEMEFTTKLSLMDKECEKTKALFTKVAYGLEEAQRRNAVAAKIRASLAPLVESVGGSLDHQRKFDYFEFMRDYVYGRSQFLVLSNEATLNKKEAALRNEWAYQYLAGHANSFKLPTIGLDNALYDPLLNELIAAIKGAPNSSEESR